MTLRKILPGILLLSLLLSGCGAEQKTPEPPEGVTAEENVPAAEESATPLLPVRSRTEVMSALENAWGGDDPQTALPLTADEGCADVMALDGDTLFVLTGRSVLVCRVGSGEAEVLTSLEVGEDWIEENGDNYWGGHEKHPAAICVLRGRLAVISDCAEYYYAVDEEGEWVFRDHSYCAVDIYDTEELENIVPMASYGQSGSFGCALVKDGNLFVATRRQLFAEDFDGNDRDDLPSLRSGEEEKKLSWDRMTLLKDGSGWYTLLSVYAPYNGVRTDSTALIGGGERMIMDAEGLSLLRGDPAEEILCSFGSETLAWTEGEEHALGAEALTEAALRGKDWRSVAETDDGAEWSRAWDDERVLELYRTDTGLRVVLSGGETEAVELELGYDFQAAAEEARGIYTDAASGTLVLPAEDGWAIWKLGEDGFTYVRSLFSPDYSENRRVFLCGGSLYAADTMRIFALDPVTLEIQGEWVI